MKTKMNIVIPASGYGSRFTNAGYTLPKPLIPVNGIPMIKKVVDNLSFFEDIETQFIFIIRKEHDSQFKFGDYLKKLVPNCKIVTVDSVTEGAACSILLAHEYINNNTPLLLANSDQYLEWNADAFLKAAQDPNIDGVISTFKNADPKFSYAKVNPETGLVTEVAEKIVISNIATTGVYYWKRGADFVKYANNMITKNIRFRNEFYTAPVFNQAIQDSKRITIVDCDRFWSLGTPEDLSYYLENCSSER
jgi:NDP-sugar pyrophosphorylase family protein